MEPDVFVLLADSPFRSKCLATKFSAVLNDIAERVIPGASVSFELGDPADDAALGHEPKPAGSKHGEENGRKKERASMERWKTESAETASKEMLASDGIAKNDETRRGSLREALARGEVPRLRDDDSAREPQNSDESPLAAAPQQREGAIAEPNPQRDLSRDPLVADTPATGQNGRLIESLNGAYTLHSFLVGPGSRVAHAAVVAVSEHPGRTYNPLCIWGPPGVGKSHLLQGLTRRLAQTSNLRIRYTTGESFTNRYITSTQSGGLDAFLDHYCDVDVLIFDDLQFLSEKRRTQEALFEIVNTLHSNDRQLVFSSDRRPSEIRGFSSRLLSRFRAGLEAMIEAPSFDTRVAVAIAKAKALQFELPTLVAEYLAQQVTGSFRELEGALACLVNVANLHRSPLTLEMARLALNEFLPSGAEGLNRAVNAAEIIDSVVEFYKVPRRDVLSPLKVRTVVRARQVAMYLTRELTPLSLAQIGGQFGGRDHTTVLYALRCVNQALAKEPELSSDLDVLRSRLTGHPHA